MANSKNVEYFAPESLDEALRLLSEREMHILAGGTDLLVYAHEEGFERPVLDITSIPGLDEITLEDGEVIIGPLVTYSQIISSELISKYCPLLSAVASVIGGPQIKNLGTLAGNIANASPAGDGLLALWALSAKVRLCSLSAERVMSIYDVVLGPKKTVLLPSELITEVRIPAIEDWGWGFERLVYRTSLAIMVVGVAAVLHLLEGRIEEVRVSAGAVAPTPVRLGWVEGALIGREPTPRLIEEASYLCEKDVHPIDDIRGSAWYRLTVLPVLVRRAVNSALRRGNFMNCPYKGISIQP